jgi:hypothetical protein
MLDKDLKRGRGGAISATSSERILTVFIGQITFNNQAYKKSPRVEGVRL